jgi:aldehyde:ferredoxin oxidoreductase
VLGWTGDFLRVDLTKDGAVAESYDADMALIFIGGIGFAVKILWNELDLGIGELSPQKRA